MIKQNNTFRGRLYKKELNSDNISKSFEYFDYAILSDYDKTSMDEIEGLHLEQANLTIKVYKEGITFKLGDKVLLFGDNNMKIVIGVGHLLTHNNYLGQKHKSNDYLMKKSSPIVLSLQ